MSSKVSLKLVESNILLLTTIACQNTSRFVGSNFKHNITLEITPRTWAFLRLHPSTVDQSDMPLEIRGVPENIVKCKENNYHPQNVKTHTQNLSQNKVK